MPPILNFCMSSATSLLSSQSRLQAIGDRQRHRQRNGNSSAFAHMSSNGKLLLTFMLLGLFVAAVSAVEEKKSTETKTVQPSPASPLSTLTSSAVAPRDEIYIDDEGIEGSGGRGELHDDLEKDPDYSGSGFGPDDEDSSTDLHTHSRRPSIQTQSGNSKQNTNLDNDLITSRTHETNSGTIIGSGTSSGNSGFIGGSGGNSGNTGLNTIGKDHSSTTSSTSSSIPSIYSSSSASTPTTQYTTTNSSIQTNLSPSLPHTPIVQHTDDDDFDLDGQIGGGIAGSGHGGLIDHDDDDNDDDDDGDDDIDDNDEGIISRVHHHNVGSTAAGGASDKHDIDEDDIDTHSKSEGRHNILGSKVDDFNEENEDDKTDNYDDHEDGDDEDTDNDNDDGTEMYTDVTDPNSDSIDESAAPKRPGINNQDTIQELDSNNINSLPPDTKGVEHTTGNEVLIMNTSDDDRTTSFFAQPGILAAVIGGAVVGLLCAILVVMFIVYRMRKKDEGSYALDEPKRSPAVNSYAKNANNREFYA